MPVPDRRILAPLALALGVFACRAPAAAVSPPPGGERADRSTAEERARQAEQRALQPGTGLPTGNADGKPVRIDPRVVRDPQTRSDPGCPGKTEVLIRAQQGSACADYQAEIAVWMERCVAACDAGDAMVQAVRAGMGACSTWCTAKGCGTASFIPPAWRCVDGQCYDPVSECANPECPLHEYCSLIGGDHVWNCLCRDVVLP